MGTWPHWPGAVASVDQCPAQHPRSYLNSFGKQPKALLAHCWMHLRLPWRQLPSMWKAPRPTQVVAVSWAAAIVAVVAAAVADAATPVRRVCHAIDLPFDSDDNENANLLERHQLSLIPLQLLLQPHLVVCQRRRSTCVHAAWAHDCRARS